MYKNRWFLKYETNKPDLVHGDRLELMKQS